MKPTVRLCSLLLPFLPLAMCPKTCVALLLTNVTNLLKAICL